MKDLFSARAATTLGAVAVLFAGPASSPAMAKFVAPTMSTAGCFTPAFSQPFASLNDSNYYTLAPGQTLDNFNGAGWTLTGGASITTAALANGQSGSVLNLPSGSQAVSPPICVTADYPSARTQVRNLVGNEGVAFSVAYDGSKTWVKPKTTAQLQSEKNMWSLTDPIKLKPPKSTGWQMVRFALTPGGTTSDFQVYNLWIDPRMHG